MQSIAWLMWCLAITSNPPSYFEHLSRPQVADVAVEHDGGPVVFIVVDALRPDHLSAYGAPRATSPQIDTLADDGVIFTNYFVNGNWTRPSTASMLTGLLPGQHQLQQQSDRLRDNIPTLAEMLHDAGVPTGAVIGNGNAGSAFGLHRGFDYYADTVKHWRGLPAANQVVDLALPFVKEHKNEPFFLMLFLVDLHDPYHAPMPYENMFVENTNVRLVRTPHWEAKSYAPKTVKRMEATYDGALRYTDTVLGKFFTSLREMGVYDRTTFVLTSDHGEAFGEHKVYLHGHHMYDEIMRAPLVVRAPKMARRHVAATRLAQSIDLLPTIAEHFHAKVPTDKLAMGESVFSTRPQSDDRVAICAFNNFGIHRWAIRSARYKLIHQIPADAATFSATVKRRALLPSVTFSEERWQAFDLQSDPREMHDIFKPEMLQKDPWRKLWQQLVDAETAEPPATAQAAPIDPETYQDLKALGYVQ